MCSYENFLKKEKGVTTKETAKPQENNIPLRNDSISNKENNIKPKTYEEQPSSTFAKMKSAVIAGAMYLVAIPMSILLFTLIATAVVYEKFTNKPIFATELQALKCF